MRVLITGSNGFIGQFLSHYLYASGHEIVSTYRQLPDDIKADHGHFAMGNINADTQWQTALSDVDVVVHLAARVHVMQETHAQPLEAFREVNTAGSLNLAQQAMSAGVKRFIYLSTIKVNGEQTIDTPFCADDKSNPQDPYAISKFEAEQQLLALSNEAGKAQCMDITIIRPPLVYGPGVKGNFSRLIGLLKKSLPLPLAGIKNARSLVNIENLCSLIQCCLLHPKASGEVFLVSDGHDLSSSELFSEITQALGQKNRLFYLPKIILKMVTYALGRRAEYERLFGSLQVDISKNKRLLNWSPDVPVAQGIIQTVRAS